MLSMQGDAWDPTHAAWMLESWNRRSLESDIAKADQGSMILRNLC